LKISRQSMNNEIESHKAFQRQDDMLVLSTKIKDFSALPSDIESLSDKKKKLWTEIYENAISDRQYAYSMFSKLSRIAQEESTEHAIHGRTMAAYIERMSKSNDQLIKLADLIAKAEEENDEIDAEEIFNKLGKGN